jgi:hypothetical protein
MSPRWGSTPRQTDRLTVGRNSFTHSEGAGNSGYGARLGGFPVTYPVDTGNSARVCNGEATLASALYSHRVKNFLFRCRI